jgi:ankyrin repeat domain-containing protein 50
VVGAHSKTKMEVLTGLLRSLDAPLTRVDEGVCALLECVDGKERLEVLEWISALPYNKYHNTVKEARTPHTYEWLMEHKRFREWENTGSSVMLWLQGSRKYLFAPILSPLYGKG